MKWLIAPLAAIGALAVAALFFRRKKSARSSWSKARDKAASAASGARDQVKGAVGS